MAITLDGRAVAKKIKEEIEASVGLLDTKPSIAIVLATADESANTYAHTIKKTAEKTGLSADLVDLGKDISQDRLADEINKLAGQSSINGIILQTPVASGIDLEAIRSLIPPEKDIDGANPLSSGLLYSGLEAFAPATAQAVIETLKYYDILVKGRHGVVIGRSKVVGKPAAHLLLDMDATVTICHSATTDLASYTHTADILVAAAGKAGLVSKELINADKNTVVIDVGTNFDEEGNMAGDVAFDDVEPLVKAITPVPGGIGPVTTAVLLKNTLKAYEYQNKLKTP
jgi:methylenetetrahydrofolate dehydrogenase (NADP+)/methenyltetrahydrofolate cyclohydrolase